MPQFAKFPKYRSSYMSRLRTALVKAGWEKVPYKEGEIYDYCDNSPNSKINNMDNTTYKWWQSKWYMWVCMQGEDFIPPTYALFNGEWVSNNKPGDSSLFFMKNSIQDSNRENLMSTSVEDMEKISKEDEDSRKVFWIVQPSIPRPLLYKGVKFDIRIGALLLTTNHLNFRLFMYKKGLVRVSSKQYSDDVSDDITHITNYALQKQFGIERPMLDEDFPNYPILLGQIVNIMQRLFRRTKHLFVNKFRAGQKMIWNVGFDFLFDHDFNGYLIEINNNPAIYSFEFSVDHMAKWFYTPLAEDREIEIDHSMVIEIV